MCFQLFSFFFCNNDTDKNDDDEIYESYNETNNVTNNEKTNYYVRHNTYGIDLLR